MRAKQRRELIDTVRERMAKADEQAKKKIEREKHAPKTTEREVRKKAKRNRKLLMSLRYLENRRED